MRGDFYVTPKKEARETFPRVVWQTSHVGPRTLETDFVIVEVSLPRRGSNGRPQISPPAGGVTREIASSPPPLLLGNKACKNARPPLTNYANERSARDTRIFSLREGKDFRHSLFLFLFAREISTRIPSSEVQGFFRGIVARYFMSIPIITRLRLCYRLCSWKRWESYLAISKRGDWGGALERLK